MFPGQEYAREHLQGLLIHRPHLLPGPTRMEANEVVDQRGDVFSSFTQGRDLDGKLR